MTRIYQPLTVTLGRVVGVFQGTNHYDINTDFGRVVGVYHGASRGAGGVMEAGTLTHGSYVWVGFSEGETLVPILGVMPVSWVVGRDDPRQLSVFPQVAGFEDEVRFSGQVYRQAGNLLYRPTDVGHDLVDGEWAMLSPHGLGGGVGVEQFRSWVRGGPMSGLWCWHDSQLTRLAGLSFEFRTLAQDDQDRALGNALLQRRSRVFYPSEALTDALPRELELAGPIVGGRQRFLAPVGQPGKARMALFHEHLGVDGAWTVTSARQVTLQRYCGIVVPEESRAPEPADPKLLADQPLDAAATRQEVLTTPPAQPTRILGGLAWVQGALDTVEAALGRARAGFRRLPVQWPDHGPVAGLPADLYHTVYTPAMWRQLPAAGTFQLAVDLNEEPRRFYVGRSMITLLPDGSVLIEDACHSQILMQGGSIAISCPNDLILAPGRNLLAIAGKDAAIRSNRHLDLASNEGRVSVKAEELLQLLGGNGGKGGVLVESRAVIQAKVGTGTEQEVGGVLLKSITGVYAKGRHVALDATDEDVILRAEKGYVMSLATQVAMRAKGGLLVQFSDEANGPTYLLAEETASLPGSLVAQGQVASKGMVSDGNVIVKGSVGASDAIADGQKLGPEFDAYLRALATIARVTRTSGNQVDESLELLLEGKTPLTVTDLGFSFATTQQLGLTAAAAFELPEMRWQQVSFYGFGTSRPWRENPVTSPAGDNQPTSPLPGYEAWATDARLRRHPAATHFDPRTGLPITPEGETALADGETVPIDTNYRINA